MSLLGLIRELELQSKLHPEIWKNRRIQGVTLALSRSCRSHTLVKQLNGSLGKLLRPSMGKYEPEPLCVCVCLVTQSRLNLCDPMDCSSPGSSVHWILQPRIMEWVAIFLPKRIFLTQGSNLHLLLGRQMGQGV